MRRMKHALCLAAMLSVCATLAISSAQAAMSGRETFWQGGGWTVISLRVGQRGATEEMPAGKFMFCIANREAGTWGEGFGLKFTDEGSGWGMFFNFPFGRSRSQMQSGQTNTSLDFGNDIVLTGVGHFTVMNGHGSVLMSLPHNEADRAGIAASNAVTINVGARLRGSDEPTTHTYDLVGHASMLDQLAACREAGIEYDRINPPAPYEPPPPRRRRNSDEYEFE